MMIHTGLKSLGVLGVACTLSSAAHAMPYDCSVWLHTPKRLGNGSRGDIALTRNHEQVAAAVVTPLGQYYTHTGVVTAPNTIRHNTAGKHSQSAFDSAVTSALSLAVSIADPLHCYYFATVPNESIRAGQPGLATNTLEEIEERVVAFDLSNLALLKPIDSADGLAVANSMDGIQGMTYDVFSYTSYSDALNNNGSMCSGAVKHAADLAGIGGFDLKVYSPEQARVSAVSLFNWTYQEARTAINDKAKATAAGILLSSPCREFMATGLANQVVSCFAEGTCTRGAPVTRSLAQKFWANRNLGSAVTISPDDLLAQPSSAYGPVVAATYEPAKDELDKRTCYDSRPQLADYDRDGKTDFVVRNPATGLYRMQQSKFGSVVSFIFGNAGDVPLPGDYDGDGRSDVAVWRPGEVEVANFAPRLDMGRAKDIPVAMDYNGDGRADYAYYRPPSGGMFSKGKWYFAEATGPVWSTTLGIEGDVPIPGDYNGDGKTDLAVFRPSRNSVLWIESSGDQAAPFTGDVHQEQLSALGSYSDWVAVPGDYDGDRKTDFAFWRAATGSWQVSMTADPDLFGGVLFGGRGDTPVPGDYDGDGKTDLAVYRAGQFRVRLSSNLTTSVVNLGAAGDVPILGR